MNTSEVALELWYQIYPIKYKFWTSQHYMKPSCHVTHPTLHSLSNVNSSETKILNILVPEGC